MPGKYTPKHVGTLDAIVDEKMKVLEELCVVRSREDPVVREKLIHTIKQYPEIDMQRIADRVAKSLIFEKFNED